MPFARSAAELQGIEAQRLAAHAAQDTRVGDDLHFARDRDTARNRCPVYATKSRAAEHDVTVGKRLSVEIAEVAESEPISYSPSNVRRTYSCVPGMKKPSSVSPTAPMPEIVPARTPWAAANDVKDAMISSPVSSFSAKP